MRYMFRPNIRSYSGLRQTVSLVLGVYWDPIMFDICVILEAGEVYGILI